LVQDAQYLESILDVKSWVYRCRHVWEVEIDVEIRPRITLL
jgi:hypothetical protein